MAKNPAHRDLFPGALEIMILQSLRLSRCMDMPW